MRRTWTYKMLKTRRAVRRPKVWVYPAAAMAEAKAKKKLDRENKREQRG